MKISVLLAALLLLFSCTDKDSKQSQDLIVKTAQAVSASGIKTTEFPFIAQPFRTSELSFRVGGPIDRLDVYAGNHYKQGSITWHVPPYSKTQHFETYPNKGTNNGCFKCYFHSFSYSSSLKTLRWIALHPCVLS